MNSKKIIIIGSIVVVLILSGYLIYSELVPNTPAVTPPVEKIRKEVDFGTFQITEDPNDVVRLFRTKNNEVILTDKENRTLYFFSQDTEGVSKCFDNCAVNWPPLTILPADALQVGSGISKGTVSSINRGDVLHVTYKGKPLYLYKEDKAAEDMKGGAIQNWIVAKP